MAPRFTAGMPPVKRIKAQTLKLISRLQVTLPLRIVMAGALALIIVMFRKFPDTSSSAVNVYSCLVLVGLFSLFSDPFHVPLTEIAILGVFAFFFILAYVTLQEGSKILPPALTSLLSILETPLAPIWAWLILSEYPTLMTILGGCIILFAVLTAIFEPPPKNKR